MTPRDPDASASGAPAALPETAQLRPVMPGLLVALAACLLGFLVGAAFGAGEDAINARLRRDANAVLATTYGGDPARATAVVKKSFGYLKRAHLHAGALGTFALALCGVLALVPGRDQARRLIALAASVGAAGYGLFWLWAGLRAPGLGGTGRAKESLAWLAVPSSALVIVAAAAAIGLLVMAARSRR